jgi:hypothetical protein
VNSDCSSIYWVLVGMAALPAVTIVAAVMTYTLKRISRL